VDSSSNNRGDPVRPDARALLEARGIVAVLIGAHAANRYRVEVRHTVDVDLLVQDVDAAATVLRSAGFDIREIADEEDRAYLLFARRGTEVVDVLLAETELQRIAMSRAVDGVVTPEDLIVLKLIAGRPRDIDDIRSIIAAGVSLDAAYIVRWANEWDVIDTWVTISSEQDD
jgi:hypothetical protein